MKIVSIVLFLSLLVAGCKPKPEEYVGKATVHINEKNFALAIEEFEKLIADHPDSPEAEQAMFTIASLQQNEFKDFRKAAEGYAMFAEKYPKSEKAPTALFLTGFLYNDELKDLEKAKKAYERFLAFYPQHDMADDAQFELKNLGKPAEELLPPLQAAPTTASQTPARKASKKN